MYIRVCQNCCYYQLDLGPTNITTKDYLERKCNRCNLPTLTYGKQEKSTKFCKSRKVLNDRRIIRT